MPKKPQQPAVARNVNRFWHEFIHNSASYDLTKQVDKKQLLEDINYILKGRQSEPYIQAAQQKADRIQFAATGSHSSSSHPFDAFRPRDLTGSRNVIVEEEEELECSDDEDVDPNDRKPDHQRRKAIARPPAINPASIQKSGPHSSRKNTLRMVHKQHNKGNHEQTKVVVDVIVTDESNTEPAAQTGSRRASQSKGTKKQDNEDEDNCLVMTANGLVAAPQKKRRPSLYRQDTEDTIELEMLKETGLLTLPQTASDIIGEKPLRLSGSAIGNVTTMVSADLTVDPSLDNLDYLLGKTRKSMITGSGTKHMHFAHSFSTKKGNKGQFSTLKHQGALIFSHSGATHIDNRTVQVIQKRKLKTLKSIIRMVYNCLSFFRIMDGGLLTPIEWGWEYDLTHMVMVNLTKRNKKDKKDEKWNRPKPEDKGSAAVTMHAVVEAVKRYTCFSGWLTPRIRELVRKDPEERTSEEIRECQRWCAPMKAFRRFTEPIQRQILASARYDRWNGGRVIIREGQKPIFYFIILDGEVEIFVRNKDAYNAAYEERKEEIESADPQTRNKILLELDRIHVRIFGRMASGDGFGDLAFKPGGTRTASIRTKRSTEFLLLERSDYEAVMASLYAQTGSGNDHAKLEQFMDNNKLFGSLKLDRKALTRLCDVRTLFPNSTVVAEGAPLESIWFVREGSINVMKLLHFVKEVTPRGEEVLHLLPTKYQQLSKTGQFEYKVEDIIAQNIVKLRNPDSCCSVFGKLIRLGSLNPGDHYGQTNGLVVNYYDKHWTTEEADDPQLMQEVMSDNDWYGKTMSFPASVSLIAQTKVEVIGVGKQDFSKHATPQTWQILLKARLQRWTLDEIICSYKRSAQLKTRGKKEVERVLQVKEVKKQLQSRRQYGRYERPLTSSSVSCSVLTLDLDGRLSGC